MLRLQLATCARLLTAAALSGGATRLHTAREVVAGEHYLEVVGDEGAHVAVGVANLVLRLVRLHHGEVGIGAFDRLVGRTVLLPPRSSKLRLLLEGGASLLHLGVCIGMTVTVGTIGLACLFLTDIVRMGIKNINLRKY